MKKSFVILVVLLASILTTPIFAQATPPAAPWDPSLPPPSLVIVPDGMDVGNPPGLNIIHRDDKPAVDPRTIPWQQGDAVIIATTPGGSPLETISLP